MYSRQAWNRGQGVSVDHAAIVEILIQQLDDSRKHRTSASLALYRFHNVISLDDEIQQSTALTWIAEFLDFVQDVMVPFAPRIIPVILPNLAHHVAGIQSAALQTNRNLFSVIESLPSPSSLLHSQPLAPSQPAQVNHTGSSASSSRAVPVPASPPPGDGQLLPFPRSTLQQSENKQPDASITTSTRSQIPLPKSARPAPASAEVALDGAISRPQSPTPNPVVPKPAPVSGSGGGPAANAPLRQDTITASSVTNLTSPWQSQPQPQSQPHAQGVAPVQNIQASTVPPYIAFPSEEAELDPFDYQATVSGLMVQFLSEYVETRVAALKWLLMLHHKAPKKVIPA